MATTNKRIKNATTTTNETRLTHHSINPAVTELERIANGICDYADVHFDSPVTVTIYPQKGKKNICYGWHQSNLAWARDKENKTWGIVNDDAYPWRNRDGVGSTELCINAEFLFRDVMGIAETLAHELTHKWSAQLRVKDSAGSNRHNKQFAENCQRLGLVPPEKAEPNIGFANAKLSEGLRDYLTRVVQPDETKFSVAKQTFQTEKAENQQPSFHCDCRKKIRLPQDVKAVCTRCEAPFVPNSE